MAGEARIDLGTAVSNGTTVRGHAEGAMPSGFEGTLDVVDAVLHRVDLRDARLDAPVLQTVTVRGGSLTGTRFDGACLLDVHFESCDLSGVQFLDGSDLDLVTFDGCKLSWSNWFDGRLDRVRFIDCTMLDARFANLRLSEVDLERCDLNGATFRTLALDEPGDLDLRGSTLGGSTGLTDVRGIRIDTRQAAELAPVLFDLHGISVADDRTVAGPGNREPTREPRSTDN